MRSPLVSFAAAIAAILLSMPVQAQISISDGTSKEPPNQDAAFEISSASQGFLMPRLNLVSLDSPKPLRKFSPGMLIYNQATTEGANGVTPGLFCSDGSRWVRISDGRSFATLEQALQPDQPKGLRGTYRPPGECRTFDIAVNGVIPENAVILLTLEHAGEHNACLSIREVDRVRNVISVTSSQMLPTWTKIHWMVCD